MTLGYFTDASPERHAAEAARQAIVLLDARDAPAGQMPVVLAPGDSGILLHEAVGHGLEADFNRKGTSNYTGQVGKTVASELCTVVDDRRSSGSGAPSTSTMRPRNHGKTCSSRLESSAGTCTIACRPARFERNRPETGGERVLPASRCLE